MARAIVWSVAAFFFWPVSFAGTPHLLLDINTHADPVSSDPVPLGRLGNTYLLGAKTAAAGAGALYQTDFTTAGTVAIKTFAGTGPIRTPFPITFLVAGSRAYFVAEETATGRNVWITDGTTAGTHIVATPTGGFGTPQFIGLIGTDLLFLQDDGFSIVQLYRTDGTAAGTRVLTQFTQQQRPKETVIANGKIYLIVGSNQSSCCINLWVSNGDVGGSHVITDPVNLPPDSDASSLAVLGNAVLFIANGNSGTELHRLDTATDTVQVLDLNANPGAPGAEYGSRILVMNGFALFVGSQSNIGDYELYRTDGTLAGTSLVADINPGVAGAFSSSRPWMAKVGDYALFFADDGTHGMQIWGSDGTAAHTAALTTSPAGNGAYAVPVAVLGTHAYFGMPLGGVILGGVPQVLTVTDGTPAGTHQVPLGLVLDRDMQYVVMAGDDSGVYFRAATTTQNPASTSVGVYKYEPATNHTTPLKTAPYLDSQPIAADAGRALFSDYDDVIGNEPWVSDGTAAGTVLLKNLAPESVTNGSDPASLIDFNGKLWFLANDGTHGQEPWQSDGTAAGTKMVADINPGPGSSAIQRPFVWNGSMYFFASDGSSPGVFMRFDGTAAQTLAVLSSPPLVPTGPIPGLYCPRPNYASLGTKLYFTGVDAQGDIELWATDGTPAGTARVVDIFPGASPSNPCGLAVFNNRLWFSANDGTGPLQLWSSDGTATGTTRFTNFAGGAGSGVVYNGAFYFSAAAVINQVSQVYRTDGTTAGTRPLVDVSAGGTPLNASPVGTVNGRLLLVQLVVNPGPPTTFTYDLWFSDGTAAGTTKIQSTVASTQSSLLITPGLLYFTGGGPAGLEPWVSDGTEAGTRMLADLNPDGDSRPAWMSNFRGVVFIAANDPVRGPRVWRTDGTTAGTVPVGDVGASPASAVVSGQNLFFTAIDPVMGRELYVLPNDAPVAGNDSGSSANSAAVSLNVTSNDSDTDGTVDSSSVRVVSAPAHGTANVGTGGSVTYTPTAGYSGSDSFTYSVADNQGNTSAAATVSLTVTAAPGSGGGGGSGGGSGSSGGGGGGGALGVVDVVGLLALLLLGKGFGSRIRRAVPFRLTSRAAQRV